MSLVGSLEDLGLGDILQIVSLSRKSGLLLLRSDEGEGRIVFRDGLVRTAHVKGEPEDLRGLLVPGGFADASAIDLAIEAARESGLPADEVIAKRTGLSMGRIASLRREQVERSVLRMFTWRVGEFSFEVRDVVDEREGEIALPTGINPQYLTMEATRLSDEGKGAGRRLAVREESAQEVPAREEGPGEAERGGAAPEPVEEEFVFSGESPAGESMVTLPGGVPEAEAPEDPRNALALAIASAAGGEPASEAGPEEACEEVAAPASETWVAEPGAASATGGGGPPVSPAAEPGPQAGSGPLVVIDPELRALEWIKSTLAGLFKRVHIFQHSEGGVGRIRQYLGRGQVPTALVSCRARADSLTGTTDIAGLLRRLRAQAPRMPVLVMHDGGDAVPAGVDAADAVLARPPVAALADRRRQEEVRAAGDELRRALATWTEPSSRRPRPRPARAPAAAPAPGLQRLRDISARLRDPATRGDVLALVLDFAAAIFSRVAMFMVRDDVAVGIAQRGLPAAGGPDDEAFRELRIALDEPAWFRAVIEHREPVRAPPSSEGDQRLWGLLGSSSPREAYVAPLESGGRVAALLYADNLPDDAPMGDSTMLAIVLHEAGLALDRALLERALAATERPP